MEFVPGECLSARFEEMLELSAGNMSHPIGSRSSMPGLGETDEALQWLEKAFADRDSMLLWLKDSSAWKGLQSEPRFQALLRRMNFPD